MQVADLDTEVWNALVSIDPTNEIVKELKAWDSEEDPDATDADLESAVRSYSVNVAQICNLKCTYCAAGGDGTYGDRQIQIETEKIQAQLRTYIQATPNGETFDITFFGGEPLLAPDTIRSLARYAELLGAGQRIQLRFRVITNGTLVTEEAAELLASIGCHVTVSLDGPPEVNDRQRKTKTGRPTTARTLGGLRKLASIRDRLGSLTIGSVFGTHNTDVLGTYLFLRDLPLDSFKFDFASAHGDASASRAFAESLANTAAHAFEKGGELELRRISFFDHAFRTLDQQKRIRNHCGAGKSHVFADAKGRLAACQWFMGRPNEKFVAYEYQSRLQDANDCGQCWASNLCGGGCLYSNKLKTGHKNHKDTAFCDRTRTLLMKAITLYADARKTSRRTSRRSASNELQPAS